ncbi:hypothetical protein TWF718_002786 [Orbilia javanica]|uniref:Uncharacterized protein n=1 Tax=Orbilia javanica TaxID=47235 RepID=A0AAN8RBJ7_9PEZI
MKITDSILFFVALSSGIAPTLAYWNHDICKAKTLWKTKYKTVTKVSTQKTTIRTTIVKTITVVTGSGGCPTAITDPPPKPASTCPPSSIITDAFRSCIQRPPCVKCSKTFTLTQTFDCDCIGQEGGSTVWDFKMKCPGDCSCTTFTRYLPADDCTAAPIFVTAVA